MQIDDQFEWISNILPADKTEWLKATTAFFHQLHTTFTTRLNAHGTQQTRRQESRNIKLTEIVTSVKRATEILTWRVPTINNDSRAKQLNRAFKKNDLMRKSDDTAGLPADPRREYQTIKVTGFQPEDDEYHIQPIYTIQETALRNMQAKTMAKIVLGIMAKLNPQVDCTTIYALTSFQMNSITNFQIRPKTDSEKIAAMEA